MLLELRQLSQILKAAKVKVPPLDDHLVSYASRKPVFRVLLTKDGTVHRIDCQRGEVVDVLVKYNVEKNNLEGSIPGFNVPPLFAPKESEVHTVADAVKRLSKRLKRPLDGDSIEARRDTLDAILGRCNPDWGRRSKQITKCLTTAVDVVASLLDGASEDDRVHLAPLQELLRRTKLTDPEKLRDELQILIRRSVIDATHTQDEVDDFLKLLIRRKNAKAGNDPDATQIMLELADWADIPANHESVWKAVKRLLVATRQIPPVGSSAVADTSAAIQDAFGEVGPLNEKTLPQVRLRVLGTVILRSLVKAKPCQARYGMTDGDSFPMARDTPPPLAEALDWLTAVDLEGKTFRDVSEAGGFTRKALLLAYPDPLPQHPPAIAAVLAATGQQGPTLPEARFVAAAELVIGQLNNLIQKTPATRIVTFVLAKGKKPPTKVLLSRQFSAERIIQAVRDWRLAAANIPPVSVRVFGEDKKPQWFQCDDVPFPSDVARCLNRVWERGGMRVETVSVFDFGSALTLLLDDGRLLAELAGQSLRLAVTQWADLLLAMGQSATLGCVCTFSPNEQRLLPPILGLLLAKLGHRKEVYMNALPFWLGRLLSVADRINKNYWDVEFERKGTPYSERQYPPQLVGNSVMLACLENPQSGLAELARQLPLYQRHAGEELRREAAHVTSHIDPSKLPSRATDEHRAQMLLGYLARPDLLGIDPTTTENQS